MARSKVVIEDSFGAIFADMRRRAMDVVDVTRQELATTIGDIIDHTPQDTGMAASGWSQAADILSVKHKPIKHGTEMISIFRDGEVKAVVKRKNGRSAPAGRSLSRYTETINARTIKRGKRKGELVKNASFEAENAVPHLTFIEYGYLQTVIRGDALTGKKGFAKRRPGKFVIRNAVKRMKQRLGPHAEKVLKINIKRPQRYTPKKTVVTP